jgi:uncharacterized membrane protein YbhN (UPF0104 family)/RimJ/RimL family protein N-acetyltransferase
VRKAVRRHLGNLLKIGVSVGLLAWVLPRIGLAEIWHEIQSVHLGWLGLAFALCVLGTALRAFRWQALLLGLGLRVSLGRLIKLYFVGTFFNTFLPSGFGGDVVRVLELAQDSRRAHEATGTVLVDRLTGILVLLAMALLALPFSLTVISPALAATLAALAIGGLVGGWLLFQERWLGRIIGLVPDGLPFGIKSQVERLYAAICGPGPKAIRQALGVSLAFNVLLIFLNYAIALSVGVDVPLGYFFLFVPPTSLALMVPTVGGLGAREWAYTELWPQVGVAAAEAGAMSLLNYAVNAATGVIGGLLYAGDSLVAIVKRPPPAREPVRLVDRLKQHKIILGGRDRQGRYVRLRPLTEDDWDFLVRWNNDPGVLYYAYYTEGDDITSYSPDQVQAIYRSVCQNAICFIIEVDGKPVGEGWLQEMNLERVLEKYPDLDCRRIDLRIGDKQYWGQGIGTEVIRLLTEFGFVEQKVDIIYEPGITDYNVRSLRAFQKVGYEIVSKAKTEPGSKADFLYDLILTREKFLASQLGLPGGEARPA